MLVARFFKHVYNFIISLFIVITNFSNWSLCNQQPRWKLSNAYPCVWFLLSSVMLNSYFVHIIASPHFNQTYTPSARNSVSSNPLTWCFLPPPEPPDTFHRTCNISFHHEKKNPHIEDKFTYSVNNTNVTYTVKESQQQKCGALIDRGANGGIAGSDTRILNTHPTRKVDIQGIDNHQLPDIPIVTAGGVVNTQRGEVILVMNQYASVC